MSRIGKNDKSVFIHISINLQILYSENEKNKEGSILKSTTAML